MSNSTEQRTTKNYLMDNQVRQCCELEVFNLFEACENLTNYLATISQKLKTYCFYLHTFGLNFALSITSLNIFLFSTDLHKILRSCNSIQFYQIAISVSSKSKSINLTFTTFNFKQKFFCFQLLRSELH